MFVVFDKTTKRWSINLKSLLNMLTATQFKRSVNFNNRKVLCGRSDAAVPRLGDIKTDK